ncbi:MAG: tetratricopeptide repeat protein [Syntrophobacteraceae bacterium]
MRDISLRMAVSVALVILCSCTQTACQGNSASVNGASQSCLLDRGEAGAMLVTLEKRLALNEGVRTAILAELARTCFSAGELAQRSERLEWYEKGASYAEMLSKEDPERVEGYYWLALNLCGICDVGGAGRALSLIPGIVENLELALAMDQSYDQGGPPRVLGRIRCKAPPWPLSEGDIKQSLVLLRTAAKIAPDNSTNHLYLAETLMQLGEAEEACVELDRALESKCHASSPNGLKEDQGQASTLKAECGSGPQKSIPGKKRSFAMSIKNAAHSLLARVFN